MFGRKYFLIITGITITLFLFACENQRTSGKGLVLPVGDIESGKATFVNLNCIQCHRIAGSKAGSVDSSSDVMLELGGKVNRVKTYGELVTSIINPSHVISPEYLKEINLGKKDVEITSPMPSFNTVMTVDQLIDLVSFLDSHYEQAVPDYVSHRYLYGAY